MKFLAVLICTINSWNVLLCCCATKVEVADKPGCHQVEMTCHESPADADAASVSTDGAQHLPSLENNCHCREHRALVGHDFLNTKIEPFSFASLDLMTPAFLNVEAKRHCNESFLFLVANNGEVSSRGAPNLAILSRFLI